MVPGSRMEGATQIVSARVRKTIQSIKEIVGNHSDTDIYVVLKETNMDPNETAQKLLNQDPFHEVKRRRDRKKEPQNVGYKESPDLQRHSENDGEGMKFHASSHHNVRTRNQNTLPGINREFRVVRDNRINGNIYKEVKPPSPPCSTSTSGQLIVNASEKGSSAASCNRSSSGARASSQALNGPSKSHARHYQKATSEEQGMILNAAAQMQLIKPNNVPQNSATWASTSSAVGVYSSSTDPVHVPSPDSRSSGVVGAVRREIGVVGVRRQSSDNSVKQSSVPSSSYANSLMGKDDTSAESFLSFGAFSKTEQFSQTNVAKPSLPHIPGGKPFWNNQYNNRPHQQLAGHQRVSQHNKEWKRKSSQKSSGNSPGVIGTPKKAASPPAENSEDTTNLQDRLSQVNIYENQNVIIAQHIRVPKTDRWRLTFGTIGTDVDFSRHLSKFQSIGNTERSNEESTASLTVPSPEFPGDDMSGSKQLELRDDLVTGSDSPTSVAAAEQQMPAGPDEKNGITSYGLVENDSDLVHGLLNRESSSPRNLDSYANIGLVRDSSPSYAPSESLQLQDSHRMPGFSEYDPPTGYDIPYFRPTMDETGRGQGELSPQEGLSSLATNSIPASTIATMQQPPPVAQMYPQVHISHFGNLMPFRQFLSPVYVPPMAMPGYSSNPPYPHPTNGSSYLLMPGGSSHVNANILKYGVQQFKPVPAGNPTGFGNFTGPTGYGMNPPGVVGGAAALEDSSRIKYRDNLYVPNPQAETPEIWIQNPRELPGMQSTPYYNLPGQTPHAAYLPSHTGHASFNAAAAQSSHMQFPGMYHASPQPAAITSPHHLGPAMGNNVGVGVAAAAAGAQVGAYQRPQLGHLSWTTNF